MRQFIFDSIFLSIFHRFLVPTSPLGNLKHIYFSVVFQSIFKNRLSKLVLIFDPILVPTWFHFGSQNLSKSSQKSIPRCINFWIDFCIDFFSILAPSWDPSWGHVGHIFLQNGGTLWGAAPLFVGSMLFFAFWVVLAPSWPNLGSILGGFGPPFWRFLGSILEVSGHDLGAMWLVILVLF